MEAEMDADDDATTDDAAATDRRTIRNIHFNAYESHITALYGNSGSGKSTMLALLTGILPTSQGTACINGYDIHNSMRSKNP